VLDRLLLLRPCSMLPMIFAAACVFPAQDPTGVEMSWRFVELNENDLELEDDEAEALTPIRTCFGAMIEQVSISITDHENASRMGTFDYACDTGFQTPDEARTEASDAFLELKPGPYSLEVQTTDTLGRTETTVTRAIDVLSRTLTIEGFDLARPLIRWRVRFTGSDDCGEVRLRLRYADTEAQLAEPPQDDDGEVVPTLYRENLASDRGLGLSGAPFACADVGGLHVFNDVDIGNYELEIDRDGQVCALGVIVDIEGPDFVIDLANLPCEG
jgi:hypothetical protein